MAVVVITKNVEINIEENTGKKYKMDSYKIRRKSL